jgi:hypothetical protein
VVSNIGIAEGGFRGSAEGTLQDSKIGQCPGVARNGRSRQQEARQPTKERSTALLPQSRKPGSTDLHLDNAWLVNGCSDLQTVASHLFIVRQPTASRSSKAGHGQSSSASLLHARISVIVHRDKRRLSLFL